jgi:hypothetical protein
MSSRHQVSSANTSETPQHHVTSALELRNKNINFSNLDYVGCTEIYVWSTQKDTTTQKTNPETLATLGTQDTG